MRTSARTTTNAAPRIRRQVRHHVGKLGALGFDVTLCRIPGPDPSPGGTRNTKPPDPHRPRRPSPAPMARVRYRAPS